MRLKSALYHGLEQSERVKLTITGVQVDPCGTIHKQRDERSGEGGKASPKLRGGGLTQRYVAQPTLNIMLEMKNILKFKA